MDERAAEWRCLLQEDVAFELGRGVPPAFAALLADSTNPRSTVFVGWRTALNAVPHSDRYAAMVLVQPRGIDSERMRRLGFGHTLSLTALPSLLDPRVFAPLSNPHVAERALDFITLYRPVARLKRALTARLARIGQLGRVGDRIVVARREHSELERWLYSATERRDLELAISPGGISHKRKLTIQTMASDGSVVAFAKLALAAAAVDATRRERDMLLKLAGYSELKGVVPSVLSHQSWPSRFATLLAPGPRRLAPSRFGARHRDFLAALATCTTCVLPFEQSQMRKNLEALMQRLEAQLPSQWRRLAPATLQRLDALFGQDALRLSMAHRDFQPGNMRQFDDGRLYVYDWDGAQPQSTPLYDYFNFTFLDHLRRGVAADDVARRVLDAAPVWFPNADSRLLPVYLAAFMLDHALRRLTNSDFARDARSVFVLDSIFALFDENSGWLTASD